MSALPSQHASKPGIIRVKLHAPAQLFNSMDPAPFVEKDLDDDAAAFIENRASDFATARPLALVIYLDQAPEDADSRRQIEAAVQNFFLNRTRQARRELSQLFRNGRVSLLVGTSFLALCLTGAKVAGQLWPDGGFSELLREGLIIGGWVAMWRPLEIHLYGWWPLLRRLRVYRKLSRIRVNLHIRGTPAAGGAV